MRAQLMSHILGTTSRVGENEGQLHLDVHTLSPLGIKLVGLVSKYWNGTDKVKKFLKLVFYDYVAQNIIKNHRLFFLLISYLSVDTWLCLP